MKIKKCYIEDIYKSIDLQETDVILYLGGRIDDDNLYPPGYRKYLKAKIKSLKPTKIICHTPWYAKKYYEKGILTKHTKIDLVLVYYSFLHGGLLNHTINPVDYGADSHAYLKTLIDKNPNIVYAVYRCPEDGCPDLMGIDNDRFCGDYDLNNVKYFSIDRVYSPKDLTEEELGHGGWTRNATDGFAMITNLVEAGFKNLNILGFSAFGSDEDQSYHTEFSTGLHVGQKYFDLSTTEDQLAEADILQSWVQTKKIKNVEDYGKLMYYLKEK